MLSKKHILILFLISVEPGVKDIYSLVKIFDRADFPSHISENLNILLENKLIFVSGHFDNGTPKNYRVTYHGKKFLKDNFVEREIVDFINKMFYPDFLLELTENYITKTAANRR